jgi:hypothetical protein
VTNLAKFTIEGTASSQAGYDGTAAQVLHFALEASATLVQRWTLQVYDPNDTSSPKASYGAPLLTLVGATSGQNVDAATPGSQVTCTLPSGMNSWIVRSVVNGGLDAHGVPNPNYVFERMVVIRDGSGRRRVVVAEATQYGPDGWARALNESLSVSVGAQSGTESGQGLTWNGTAFVPVRDALKPVLDPTGASDSSAAINAALNTRDGAEVRIPYGVYRLDNPIVFARQGCTLVGPERGFRQPRKVFPNGYVTNGALFNVNHFGNAVRWDQPNCSIRNFEFYYPNQSHNPTVTTVPASTPGSTVVNGLTNYDFTFWVQSFAHGASIENITCHNPYQLIKFEGGGGTISTIKSNPLYRGVVFPRCGAAPGMVNVQFNGVGDYDDMPALQTWIATNGIAFALDGVEGYNFLNCNANGYAVGLEYYDQDGDGFSNVYGDWHGLQLEGCVTCIRVHNTGRTYNCLAMSGASFHGGKFVPAAGGYMLDCADTAVPVTSPVESEFPNRPNFIFHGNNDWAGQTTNNAARMIWQRSGSYAHVTWTDGSSHNCGAGEHIARVDSSTSSLMVRGIKTPAGKTRIGGTAALTNPSIFDREGEEVAITGNTGRRFIDFWDFDFYEADRTGAKGSANFFAGNPPKGLWEVDIYQTITTAGTSGNITTNIFSTDDTGSNTQTTAALNVSATNRQRTTFLVETNGSTQIAFSIDFNSIVGAPHVSTRLTARRISRN